MRGRLVEDQSALDSFMKNLDLPKYDGEENPADVKEELLASKDNKEDQEAREEAERKR